MTFLIHRNKHGELGKMRGQNNTFLMKEQDKNPEELREVEIIDLLKKNFKVIDIKMLNKLERKWINIES